MTPRRDVPAFPLPPGNEVLSPETSGMSLRDYFAAKALPACIEAAEIKIAKKDVYVAAGPLRAAVCADAYAWADAMLTARGGVV